MVHLCLGGIEQKPRDVEGFECPRYSRYSLAQKDYEEGEKLAVVVWEADAVSAHVQQTLAVKARETSSQGTLLRQCTTLYKDDKEGDELAIVVGQA